MKRPVRIAPLAEADITQAADWYEAQKEGLGNKFVDRVFEAIDKIAINPLGHAPVVEDLRRVGVLKFPYGVFYRVLPDASIVVACLHAKRHVRLAKARALGKPEP